MKKRVTTFVLAARSVISGLPQGARAIAVTGERACVLHIEEPIDATQPFVTKVFHTFRTDEKFEDTGLTYVGTTTTLDGTVHVYEETN